jgi:site-specific DNA-cytosine methylase
MAELARRPTVGSLFAGVGGFDLGFEAAGFEVRWQVEIDRDCISVLERHWPDTPRWRDVSQVEPAELPPVDVVVFGSPCQDLSVAGKRAGLAGERSGLFGEAIRLIRGLRPAPALCLWENVPGALSSAGGRDFGAVLDALAESGALDLAWRVLDARYFGVPQRRRRLFVVADFGAERAGQVLFEPASGQRHPAAGRAAGQGPAGDAADGAGGARGPDTAYTLRGNRNGTGASDNAWNTTYVPVHEQPDTVGTAEPVVYQCHGNNVGAIGTLRQGNGGLTGGVPFVANSVTRSAGHHGHSSPRGDGADNLVVEPEPRAFRQNLAGQVFESEVMAPLRAGATGGMNQPTVGVPEPNQTAMALTAGGHPNSNAPGRHREDDQNLLVVPISSDAAAGRSGDAVTPSADAEGVVRLRPPSAGIGEDGDPAYSVNASAPPAVAFNWQAGAGDNDHSFRGKSRQYVTRAGDYAGSLSATRHDAVAIRIGQQGANGIGHAEEEAHALDAGGPVQAVAFHLTQDPVDAEVSPAVGAGNEHGCSTIGIGFYPTGGTHGVSADADTAPALKVQAGGAAGWGAAVALPASEPRCFAENYEAHRETSVAPTVSAEHGLDPRQNAGGMLVAGGLDDGAGGQLARALNCQQGIGDPLAQTFLTEEVDDAPLAVSENVRAELRETSYAQSLAGLAAAAGQGYQAVRSGMTVRRLTPRECERLQGWPDDFSRYRADGTEIQDGPRYRMIGNGVVAPVAYWLARRMYVALTEPHYQVTPAEIGPPQPWYIQALPLYGSNP